VTRVVFMGTPGFAVPTLRQLIESYDVVGVLTQPDRPAGRGQKLAASPVKELALAHGLTVLQPKTLRKPELLAELATLQPDVMVAAAYGLILPQAVLDLAPHGCLNVHASLLPRWRGAAPITAAILAGDAEIGVTIMRMDAGMDTGDVLAQRAEPIRPDDTTGSLSARLAELGAELLIETLPRWLACDIEPQPQDHNQATYCKLLSKEDGRIDWTQPAEVIARQVRAYDPWPGTFTTWEGKRLKVLKASPQLDWAGSTSPGQVIDLDDEPGVATGKGVLVLHEVQLEGKRAMDARTFLVGYRGFIGSRLGSSS
jgi:methionyl-tRNA formyltransferase